MRAGPIFLFALLACNPSRPTRNRPEEACVQLGPFSSDTTCAAGPCRVEVEQQRCRASLVFEPYDGTTSCPDPIDVEVDLSGRILVAGESSCASIEPVLGAQSSLECRDLAGVCRVDLLAKTAPVFSATTLEVVRRPFYFPESERCRGATCGQETLDYYSPFGGDLSAIAFSGDEAWVARRATPSGFSCPGMDPSVIHFYDRRSLTETGTATVPPCTDQLAADPEAPGEVIGLTSSFVFPKALRFGPNAEIITERVIDAPLDFAAHGYRPIAIRVRGDRIFGVWVSDDDHRPPAIIVRLDRRTLAVVETYSLPTGEHFRGVIFGETRMLVIDRGGSSGKAVPIELDSFEEKAAIGLDATRAGSNDGGQGVLLHADQDFVVSTTGSGGGVYYQEGDSRKLSFPYESDAVPFAVSLVPGSETLAVGLTARTVIREASIALYSPAGARFLPGQVPIGAGAVLAIEPDPEGRLWAILPWAGQVVVLQKQ